MASNVETAVDTLVRASNERDSAKRAKLIEACFAKNGRIASPSREIRGREALAEELSTIHSDELFVGIRLSSAIDAGASTFRYSSVLERRDHPTLEFFDTGEVNADGRISLILTFPGPLSEVGQPHGA